MNQEALDHSETSHPLSNTTTPWSNELIAAWINRDATASHIDAWIHWNNSPIRHASPEVLASCVPASFLNVLEHDSRVSIHVDDLLRAKLSWSSPVHWAPQDPLWDVAMISPSRFKSLALLSASFSMRREITQLIDGSLVRKVRKQIGEDIFQFVLLSNASKKYFLEPMYANLSKLDDITQSIDQGAIMIMEHGFSSKERGIQERVGTKLHGCFAQGYCDHPLPWALQAEEILASLWKETLSWL